MSQKRFDEVVQNLRKIKQQPKEATITEEIMRNFNASNDPNQTQNPQDPIQNSQENLESNKIFQDHQPIFKTIKIPKEPMVNHEQTKTDNQEEAFEVTELQPQEDAYKQTKMKNVRLEPIGNSNQKQNEQINNVQFRQQQLQENRQDQENEQDDQEEQEDEYYLSLKNQLKKLFYFYSSFANRVANNKIKCSQFIKIAKDADLIGPQLSIKELEIMFIGVSKGLQSMGYDDYVRLLHSIAQKKFDSGDQNENFRRLLEENVVPLYETVYNETDLGIEDKILKSKINVATLIMLNFRKEILQGIYQRYFQKEMIYIQMRVDQTRQIKQSKQDLIKFLRDFELLPNLLNLGIVSNFYNELLTIDIQDKEVGSLQELAQVVGKELGFVFTSHRFVCFLVKISLYIFSDLNNIPPKFRDVHFTSDEKFYMLLERLEISQGFCNFSLGKIGRLGNQRLTLSAKQLSDFHKETSAFPNFESYLSESEEKQWMILNYDIDVQLGKAKSPLLNKLSKINIGGSQVKQTEICSHKNIQQQIQQQQISQQLSGQFQTAIQKYKGEMLKIFNHYATVKTSTIPERFSMNSFKFIQFLKDCQLARLDLEQRRQTCSNEEFIEIKEADIIFQSLTHGTLDFKNSFDKHATPEKIIVSKSINFTQFLKALELIVKKIYSDCSVQQGFEQLYFKFIVKNLLSNSQQFIPDTQTFQIDQEKNQQQQQQTFHQSQRKQSSKTFLSQKYIVILCELLKDQGHRDFLCQVHEILFPVYQAYANDQQLLSCNYYQELLKDFDLFPHIIAKVKIDGIFEALSYIYKNDPDKREQKKGELIDQHLFAESFALLAQDLKFKFSKELNLFQKVCYLLEVMNESQGFAKAQLKSPTFKKIDLISKLRGQHPEYFVFQ